MKNCTFVSMFINSDVFEFIFLSFFSYTAFKKTFHWYDSTVKSINFAIIMTCFNIFYAIFIISHYCSNPRQKHVKLMTELFHYIKKIIDYGIIYQTNGLFFLNYVDFDFVEIVNDRCFITEWVFHLLAVPFLGVSKNKTSSHCLSAKPNIMSSAKSKKKSSDCVIFLSKSTFLSTFQLLSL